MPTRLQRQDAHNVSVDDALASAGRCGMTHLRTGRRCVLPARHRDSCQFAAVPAVAATPAAAADRVGAPAQPAGESLTDLLARLVTDYAGQVPASLVIEIGLAARDELRAAGVPEGQLVAATERAARSRLADWEPAPVG